MSPQHQLSPPEIGFLDKNKTGSAADSANHYPRGSAQGANANVFDATGAGSTTTLVGAAADLTTSKNCLRLGERFMLYTSAGVPKEATVFTCTAHNGTTTVTFTPAAAVATANGDNARIVGGSAFDSNDSLDNALIGTGVYTQAQLDRMTQNDKVYAWRVIRDPQGFK